MPGLLASHDSKEISFPFCQSDKSPPDTVKDLLLYKANSSSLSTVNVHKTLTQPTSKKDQKLKIFASKYYKLMLVEW